MTDYSTLNRLVAEYKALQVRLQKNKAEYRTISSKMVNKILEAKKEYKQLSDRSIAVFFGVSNTTVSNYKKKGGETNK